MDYLHEVKSIVRRYMPKANATRKAKICWDLTYYFGASDVERHRVNLTLVWAIVPSKFEVESSRAI